MFLIFISIVVSEDQSLNMTFHFEIATLVRGLSGRLV